MKKIIAGVMGFLMMGMIVVEAGAASRVSSSSRSSYSSSSRSSYSAPKQYSAPAVSAPSRSTSSNPGLKALGFSKPAPTQTVSRPSASVPSSRPTSTVNTGWFGKKSVSSAPAYKAPVRKVSSPVGYSSNRSVYSSPRTTVIQRNYYGNSYGGYNGYNRGYGGGYGYGGYNSGGSSFLYGAAGAVGGMMLYNALSTPHHYGASSGATAAQIEQAKTDQRIEDKLDMQNQLLMQQRQPAVATPVVMQQPQCFLPPDAPLMMNPQFYCGGNNVN